MLVWFLFSVSVPILFAIGCSKGKSEGDEDEDDQKKKKAAPSSGAPPSSGNNKQQPSSGSPAPTPKLPPQAPPPSAAAKPPAIAIKAGENKIVDAYDPNYQTLAAVGANAFGADKAAAAPTPATPPPPPPPKKDLPKAGENKIADAYDPNYQTLAAIGGGDAFGADKKK